MAIMPFKVTDFGTNQKPICNFLLVIMTNLPPVLHSFQVMAVYVKFSPATGGRFTLTPERHPVQSPKVTSQYAAFIRWVKIEQTGFKTL